MKKILSLILMLSVIFTHITVLAETATEEADSDVLEITLLPKDYATIHITKTGYSSHTKYAKTLAVYYNTLYTGSVYAEFGSVISSYKVPFKDVLKNMSISYYVAKGGMQEGRTIPVIYDFDRFHIDAEPGIYKGPVAATDTTEAVEATAEYAKALEYTAKYWPQNNKYGYSGENLAYSILETETGTKAYDVTETAMAAFVDEGNTSEYITFATGRETSEYANGSFKHDSEELIPKLTLQYSKSGILNIINSTTEEDIPKLMEDLVDMGILSNTENGADAYKTLIKSAKDYVNEQIYETIKSGGFTDLESFYAAYDTHVEYAVTNGMLLAINGVESADEMAEMIAELGDSGALDNISQGYEGYTRLNDEMKAYVDNALYEVVLNGGFADLTAICEEYDKAVIYVSQISAKVLPENFATIHITKDGYSSHTKYAKKLAAYYNTKYQGSVYAEFGSIITSYNIPLKSSIKDIGISYYVIKGGMQTGRTIPVFYDYNKFSIDAEAGSYLGPVAATDTTDAVEATKEYSDILSYTAKYWPANGGYSYSATEFASQAAFNILETETGTKIYDVTEIVLDGYLGSDSDYITFATGRETSEYANGSFEASDDENMPKLIITYDALKVLDVINNTAENDVVELIDNLGKSGILEKGEEGYDGFKNLSNANKTRTAGIIYDIIKNGGYSTFEEFINNYDFAVTNSETKITDIKIYDSEKEYNTAKDAAGKEVTVKATVKFAEKSGTYKAILAEYSEGKLIGAVTKDLPYSESEVEFTKTLSSDITDAKIIILDSLSGMKPIAKSVNDRFGVLDGKKVIFIGNSHTYRGMTVIEKELDILDQASRSNDTGYFYQMCKANGWDVEVTNWTFSGHALYHTFGGEQCTYNSSCKGKIHEDYLTDRYFDYVFINSGTGTKSEEQFMDNFTYIMDFFKSVNPDVKFVCLGTASSYGCNQNDIAYPGVTSSYKTLEEKGVIIADWGAIIAGVINGKYTVPGAKHEYTKSSFIVSDQYHANALTGYLTTLTAYCAVTGESAVGKAYAFYNDTTLNSKFDIPAYINKYYTNGTSDTNFHEIFQSESDMRGLQQLVDKVLKEKEYREY